MTNDNVLRARRPEPLCAKQRCSWAVAMLAIVPAASAVAKPRVEPQTLPMPPPARTVPSDLSKSLPDTGPWTAILEVASVPVHSHRAVVLRNPRPIGGINVRIGHWPPPSPSTQPPWLLVRGIDGTSERCFGPGLWDATGSTVVRDVSLLARSGTGGQSFELQAFAPSEPTGLTTACAQMLAKAKHFSSPVRVDVANQPLLEQDGSIRIATFDGAAPGLDEPAVVSPNTEVSGTVANEAASFVYLFIGKPGSAVWQAEGPAEVHGSVWTLRNLQLDNHGGKTDSRYLLVAAAFSTRLSGRDLLYSVWRQQALAATPTQLVLVEPKEVPTRLTIESVLVDGQNDPLPLSVGTPAMIERVDQVATVAGRAIGAVNAPIWVVTASARSGVVRVHGPASMADGEWSFSGWTLRETGNLEGDRVRAYVVTSDAVHGEGLAWEEGLLRSALAQSPTVFIQLQRPLKPREPINLAITEVHDEKVERQMSVPVFGENLMGVSDEPTAEQHIQLRAAVRTHDAWALSPAVVLQGRSWAFPSFSALANLSPNESHDLLVLATEFPIAEDTISTADLNRIPVALSPIVTVYRPEPLSASARGGRVTTTAFWWLTVLVLALLALLGVGLLAAKVQRRTNVVSTCDTGSENGRPPFEKTREALRRLAASAAGLSEKSRLFEGRGAILDSVLGLLVLGVLGLVISCYLPLYEKVISTVLVMPRRTSLHLATALVSFAALSGVLMEVSTKLLWPAPALPWAKRIPRHGMAVGVFMLMLACTVALCAVNTLIYASFYHRQAPAVALAFSAASALMSVVEVVGFYVGINLDPLVKTLTGVG